VELRDLHDYPLCQNEKIVLYSDGGIHSAQAWFLLRAEGFAGQPRTSGGAATKPSEVVLPKVKPPTPVAAPRARKKHHKEGC
jgi:hypothetical protein